MKLYSGSSGGMLSRILYLVGIVKYTVTSSNCVKYIVFDRLIRLQILEHITTWYIELILR